MMRQAYVLPAAIPVYCFANARETGDDAHGECRSYADGAAAVVVVARNICHRARPEEPQGYISFQKYVRGGFDPAVVAV